MKLTRIKKNSLLKITKSLFWFCTGGFLGLFLFASFAYIVFQNIYKNHVYPGVTIDNVYVGEKTRQEIRDIFQKKNAKIGNIQFLFKTDADGATISAKEIEAGFDGDLLSDQAISIGRSDNIFSNISLVLQAYVDGLNLTSSYRYNDKIFSSLLYPVAQKISTPAVDALFQFQEGRVVSFRPSQDGKDIDVEKLKNDFKQKIPFLFTRNFQTITVQIPIKVLKPSITTDQVNSLGIHELIGTGTSLFQGSIVNRVHNVTLAASRINGILVAPGETFSFNKALGDVSSFTGYKQAYIIENGKTVLGDGGGVCQVSTTLFRAVLNAGLPIAERTAHAYRVHYYEEDTPPGIDATVYSPSVDFKFKNDTGKHILIQASVDPSILQLTFSLYGTKDNRLVSLTKPVITNETPAPEPLYQDDPTLPKGEIKQVDFAASGARAEFKRIVTKNGKMVIAETFVSNYRPWQAVFLRGTQ